MNSGEIIVAVSLAALFALLFALLFFEGTLRFVAEVRERFGFWLQTRKTGLKAVYPVTHKLAEGQLGGFLQSASPGDEVLLIGRTFVHALEENKEAISNALRKGVVVKLLLLDRKVLIPERGRRIDLRSLGHVTGGRLATDIGKAEHVLNSLKTACQSGNHSGSLLVYRINVVVQNSVVIHLPKDEAKSIRILFSISFGEAAEDKFTQYYRGHRTGKRTDFCTRLQHYYTHMLENHIDIASFAYDLSYCPPQNGGSFTSIKQMAVQRMGAIISGESDCEEIRRNRLCNIVPDAVAVFRSISQRREEIPGPISAQIELTNRCSTSCTHCSRFARQDNSDMALERALRLLDELSELKTHTVTFSGGEPTQHPKFAQIIGHARKKDLAVGVLSNGVGLSPDARKAILAHAAWLRLSVDGSSPAVYEKVRRGIPKGISAFKDVMETIQTFADQPGPCKLAICYTIQHTNVQDVAEMIRLVRNKNLDDNCLIFKFAHGAGQTFLCTEEQLTDLQNKVLNSPEFEGAANLDYLRLVLERRSNTDDVHHGLPTGEFYLRQSTRCFTPHMFTLIDAHGDVYPCCFLYEDNGGYGDAEIATRSKHCLGHLGEDKETLKQIWEGDKYRELRNELAVVDPTLPKYSRCGECTRHCNHNRSLTRLHAEYDGLRAVVGEGQADEVLNEVARAATKKDYVGNVWL